MTDKMLTATDYCQVQIYLVQGGDKGRSGQYDEKTPLAELLCTEGIRADNWGEYISGAMDR